MKKKHLLNLLLLIFISAASNAQLYKNALGLRVSGVSSLGGPGVTFKHYLNETSAVEAIFSFKDPIGLGAMYQVHKPWNVIANLNWYYGGGAFVTFSKPSVGFGGMGIIGVDYKFEELPLNIALDWKPELALAPTVTPNFNTFALSLRVTLDKK
jgi:hypothetical protein